MRLFDGKSVGTIDAIEKRSGRQLRRIYYAGNLEALDLVQAAKKSNETLIIFYDGPCVFAAFVQQLRW